MRSLIERLCADDCAGRATGTAGGRLARSIVVDALRGAGLDPHEQALPNIGGANVLATVRGETDRYVLVGAHFDHLGQSGTVIYPGADDNAAAVAVLVEVARALALRPARGRGVIFAAFDAEEPPYFATENMGSAVFAAHPTVPLEQIDLMVCLELIGHALGPAGMPSAVRDSMFALGGERSKGTLAHLEALATSEPGLVIRPADAEVIPPLSDYFAFWGRSRPFLLLTGARSRRYHTPDDVPAHLDFARIAATARWVERFVRAQCERPAEPFGFVAQRDDRSTLDSLGALLASLAPVSPLAARAQAEAVALRGAIGRGGALPPSHHARLGALVQGIELVLA
jgi:hypothetical protein